MTLTIKRQLFTIHPLGIMNVWIRFYGSPSNSCWDISIINKNVNLMVVKKGEKVIKVSQIKRQGTMNIWTKFRANPSCRCWDISQNISKHFDLLVALEGSPISVEFILCRPWKIAVNFKAKKIFHHLVSWITVSIEPSWNFLKIWSFVEDIWQIVVSPLISLSKTINISC